MNHIDHENYEERIDLWYERQLLEGMDVLRSNCCSHRYSAHAHESFVVAAFSGGAQKYRIGKTQGVALPGTVMIIPCGEIHTGESALKNGSWSYSAFYPGPEIFERMSEHIFGHTRGSLDFGSSFLIEDEELALNIVQAATITLESIDLLEKQEVVQGVFDILIKRYSLRDGSRPSLSIPNAPIQKSIEYIADNIYNQLSIHEISKISGLSDYHFMRLFKSKINMTVHQFVTYRRLQKARALLIDGMPVASVGPSVGFYDQSHFTRHFRRAYGVTPYRYARACR